MSQADPAILPQECPPVESLVPDFLLTDPVKLNKHGKPIKPRGPRKKKKNVKVVSQAPCTENVTPILNTSSNL